MDRFGGIWVGHQETLERNWRAAVLPDDLVLVLGDTSWAMSLPQAREDLEFLDALPGRKLLIRGNHDYWWASRRKLRAELPPSLGFLQHDSVVIGRTAIVGTRGWDHPDLAPAEKDRKIYHREVERLRMAFEHLERSGLPHERVVVAVHHKPMGNDNNPSELTTLMAEHGAEICLYGHIHDPDDAAAFNGELQGVRFRCLSADLVGMRPRVILDEL